MAIVEEIDNNTIPIYLQFILDIKKWMEENKRTNPPRSKGKDLTKEEKELGNALNSIRQDLINPYKELQTEEEKEKYKKEYPELEEVMLIVEEIDRNNIAIKEEQPYYINILKIKKWMEENNTINPPRSHGKDLMKEERKLGRALVNIKQKLIQPYKKLQTEEEREEYKRKHPELDEVMAIVKEIDRNKSKINEKVKQSVASQRDILAKGNGEVQMNFDSIEKKVEQVVEEVK